MVEKGNTKFNDVYECNVSEKIAPDSTRLAYICHFCICQFFICQFQWVNHYLYTEDEMSRVRGKKNP